MTDLWQAIDQYLTARAPQEWHRAEVRRYRERIHSILRSKFRLVAFFQSGSFQHGTAVMPYSDIDYMARIDYGDKPPSSNTILNKMRDVLKGELWEADEVVVSRPTVTLKFQGFVTNYEITPAYWLRGSSDENRVVQIPASAGAWREAAPQAHNKFVADTDDKHNGNVREIARLLKAWKYEHSVPISSFYLEMRSAEYGKNNNAIWSLITLRTIVAKLIITELAAMNDPTGLVSRIMPCSGETARLAAMAELRKLKKNLDAAYEAHQVGESQRWAMNQALQAIWGPDFPYCDPSA